MGMDAAQPAGRTCVAESSPRLEAVLFESLAGDAGVFGTFEQLTGSGQFYALQEVGSCFEQPLRPGTLRKGDYTHRFEWDGRNWGGPSDTGEHKVTGWQTIRAKGYSDVGGADAGSGDAFEASTTLSLLLQD